MNLSHTHKTRYWYLLGICCTFRLKICFKIFQNHPGSINVLHRLYTMMNWVNCTLLCLSLFFQDSIQTILLSLTSRIAETHLIHEKRRILSMYRLFVLLLLKDLPEGLGNTWAFFIRDVIYSLLRIIGDETQVRKHSRQQQVHLIVDDDLFVPCCNLIYYVCEAAVGCCSQVG